MKRGSFIFLIIVAVLCMGIYAYAENVPMPIRTLVPELDNTYDVGTDERKVREIKANSFDKINYATCTNAGDLTYTLTLSNYPTLEAGLIVYFVASTPNTTGTANISYNSTVDSLKMLHDQAPAASYIESSSCVQIMFNGTNWELVSPDNNP